MLYLVSSVSGLIKKMYVNNSLTDNLACALPGGDSFMSVVKLLFATSY